MNGHEALGAAQWLWRFCSPWSEPPPLPQAEAWPAIFEIADRNLILPRLAIRVEALGGEVDVAVAEFLAATLELGRYRNERLRGQLLETCHALNAVGIEPILLKGAPMLLVDGPLRDERMMLDLDIWVPDIEEQARAVRSLEDIGYAMRGDPGKYLASQHYPPFYRDGEIARIELHRHMVPHLHAPLLDQRAIAGAAALRHSDGIDYRLIADRAALALSYLQCLEGIATSRVTMMKWFDFLDRARRLDIEMLEGRSSLNLLGDIEQADAQLLTAMSLWCGLPYQGPRDERFAHQWERRFLRSPVINFLKWVSETRRWRGKSVRQIVKAIGNRLRRSHFRLPTSRDGFRG